MKYCEEGGQAKFEYDLAILNDIHDQVKSTQDNSSTKDAAGRRARRDQRRAERQDLSDSDALKLLSDGGFIG